MPNAFEVILKITSDTLSLPELERRFGPSGPGSHDKSELNPRGHRWSTTIWRRDANSDASDLGTQCGELIDSVDLTSLEDVTAVVDLVVYFSSVTVSTSVPPRTIRKLGEHGVGLEISCYPVPPNEERGSR
jgi:hypothetical protein